MVRATIIHQVHPQQAHTTVSHSHRMEQVYQSERASTPTEYSSPELLMVEAVDKGETSGGSDRILDIRTLDVDMSNSLWIQYSFTTIEISGEADARFNGTWVICQLPLYDSVSRGEHTVHRDGSEMLVLRVHTRDRLKRLWFMHVPESWQSCKGLSDNLASLGSAV